MNTEANTSTIPMQMPPQRAIRNVTTTAGGAK
jgi:hypothetical protein